MREAPGKDDTVDAVEVSARMPDQLRLITQTLDGRHRVVLAVRAGEYDDTDSRHGLTISYPGRRVFDHWIREESLR